MGNKWEFAHLGRELYRLVGPEDRERTILEEATEAVDHDREAKYGHPLDDFTTQATYWRTHLAHKYGIDVPIEAEDVAVMMVQVKLAREAVRHGRDNLVDGAGYLRTLERVIEERRRRSPRPPPPPVS